MEEVRREEDKSGGGKEKLDRGAGEIRRQGWMRNQKAAREKKSGQGEVSL